MGQGGVKKQNRNNPIFFLLCSRCRSRRWWWKERKGGGRGKRRDQGLVKVSVHAQSAFRTIQWWWSYINYSKNKNFVYPPNSYLNYYYYILNTITWSSKQKYWYCISHPTGSSTPPPLLTLYHFINDVLKDNHFSSSDISHFHVRIIIIIINHCSFLNCQVLHYPPKTKMIFVCISPSLRASRLLV